MMTLKIGDHAEFHVQSYPPPQPEWQAERVREIRILDHYSDKKGVLVQELSWDKIRSYQYLVLVCGERRCGP